MKQGSFPITQLVLPISYNLPTQSSLRSFHWIQPLNMAWGASKSAWVTCSWGQHLYWFLQSQLPWPLSIVLPDSWPFSSALNSPFFPGTLMILPSREWLTIYLYYKWLLTNLWLVDLIIKVLKKAKLDKQQKMLLSLRFILKHTVLKYMIVVVYAQGQSTTWSLPIVLHIGVLLFLK